MGGCATGREHHGIDSKAPFGGLLEEFPGSDHVAQRTQGRVIRR